MSGLLFDSIPAMLSELDRRSDLRTAAIRQFGHTKRYGKGSARREKPASRCVIETARSSALLVRARLTGFTRGVRVLPRDC
jgi:hypothetical protein